MNFRPLAILAVGTIVLSGCGGNDDTASTSNPAAAPTTTTTTATMTTDAAGESGQTAQAEETATGTPTDDQAAPATATSSPPTSVASSPARAASLPTVPGDYGDALVEAWTSGDSIAPYTTSGARSALSGTAPSNLLRTACEAAMCSYSNEAGDRVTLTFDLAKVERGAEQAVTAVRTGTN